MKFSIISIFFCSFFLSSFVIVESEMRGKERTASCYGMTYGRFPPESQQRVLPRQTAGSNNLPRQSEGSSSSQRQGSKGMLPRRQGAGASSRRPGRISTKTGGTNTNSASGSGSVTAASTKMPNGRNGSKPSNKTPGMFYEYSNKDNIISLIEITIRWINFWR
jgi:hypothetical protein